MFLRHLCFVCSYVLLFVYKCVPVLLCSCALVFVCSLFRVFVFSCVRMFVCLCVYVCVSVFVCLYYVCVYVFACMRACLLACLHTCVHACVDLYRYQGLPPTNELTAVLRQVHMENERVYFCLTCHTVTCTSCVIDEHDGHNVAEANTLYKQNMNDVRDLLRNLDGEVKRQRDVKAKIGTRREQIAQSYQQVCIISHAMNCYFTTDTYTYRHLRFTDDTNSNLY